MAHPPLLIGAASRPRPGETANGDAWTVDRQDGRCRLAVIDGLGHGEAAAAAAQAAVAALASRPDLAPDEALRLCHRALSATRGAAISVAQIAAARLTFAGVGNVEARLWQPGSSQRLLPSRGIVGARLPDPRPVELTLGPSWLLLLHTDGVRTRLELEQLAPIDAWEPQALAAAVLARWSRASDDATVVVARPAPAPASGPGGATG